MGWLSFFLMLFRGQLQRSCAAVKETWHSGVNTADFLALSDWDNDVAGVPALLLKIYVIPFAKCENWLQVAINIIFMLTSTKAMAEYIVSTIDFKPIVDMAYLHRDRNFSIDGVSQLSASEDEDDSDESETDDDSRQAKCCG